MLTLTKTIKKTKIIATLGPASLEPSVLRELILDGIDIVRINASHAKSPEEISEKIALIKRMSEDLDRFTGIFLDLQGPKIRVGRFPDGPIELAIGDHFTITTDEVPGTQDKVTVDYKGFSDDVVVGDAVFIDDGRVQLKVIEKNGADVRCEVTVGGKVSDNKGVNLPYTNLSMPAMTEKDFRDCKAAVEGKVDYIALSFVSRKEDVLKLREYMDSLGGQEIRIISKIELQNAVDNFDSILDVTDVVMVARGDLGVEIGVQNVPKVQKEIIKKCNMHVKPVIVATQMLESMITAKTATRAEVSDVANAIYDGCDVVMLSGETAVGISPVTVVNTMKEICIAADTHLDQLRNDSPSPSHDFAKITPALSFCMAADKVANELSATAIMTFTSSGNTPLMASKLSSAMTIIAATDSRHVCTRLAMYRGITPVLIPEKFISLGRWTNMINAAVRECKLLGHLKEGDLVIITAGIPVGVSNGINSIRMVTIKDY